ncbi:divalent-cation tolerance protein CutA [Ornithinimicrobium cryptoxanthini]|uniref:divalent-cation tolerance protein CutA n=1 Tax=Ornithinimicrobium cryptoxanthini TaxID=2934161 RepID=UPI0021187497|nr:divalent-cation tolerance protein CutA [Ornithinimicrobium cryptoxanthini]
MSDRNPLLEEVGTSPLVEIRVSAPDAEAAHAMAKEIVGANLAACVQCLGPMTSVYSWKGEVHQATEWLLLIKTTADMFQSVSDLVMKRHRYAVPEIVAVPVSHALSSYSAWVRDSVLSPSEGGR